MEDNHDLEGVDDPEFDNGLIPELCTYMVFALDPVGTLEHLGDGDATSAAQRLPSKKYVAYVADVVVSGTSFLSCVTTMLILHEGSAD